MLQRAQSLMLGVGHRSAAQLAAGFLIVAACFSGLAGPVDNYSAAQRAGLTERAPSGSIVLIEIDASSVHAAQTWPWPRERFATAVHNLTAAGAGLIAFDVDFSAQSNSADDAAMRAAIAADPGSVVLPTFVQLGAPANTPLASLSRDAVLASVNVQVDRDGKVRRYQHGYRFDDQYYASMASVLAGAPYGRTEAFLIDYGIRAEAIDRISFNDVYDNNFDPTRVRGKVVLIGATALELRDQFPTPKSPATPGVVIHALAYESLIQGRALVEPHELIVLGLALLVLLALWPRRGPLDLRAAAIRHAGVLLASWLGPVALQMFAPISADLGLVTLAQGLCVAVSVNRELHRRAAEIVRQREQHLSFVALHDPETDLPNRRAMLEELARRLDGLPAKGEAVVVAVAIGIDRFTILRGAIGYGAANQVVRSLSAQIAECSGQKQVFHISTSILGVVVEAPSEAAARQICDAKLAKLDTRVVRDGNMIEARIHAGSAAAVPASAEMVLERATLALDQARLQNRRCVHYDPNAAIDPMLQLALTSDVGAGLARGEFSMLYQAKFSARARTAIGAEALVRWLHPVHGEIPPDLFVPIAEETGAIDELTRWVLARVVEDQAALRSLGVDALLSVNLSGRSLADSDFCAFAIEAVQRARAHICFEITETAIIEDPTSALASLEAFRAAGIRLSVDDYGAGLSSLSYLKQIDADELKLDKSLVLNFTNKARDRLLVKSTIDLAHGLGMSVVAEGVEDEATLAALAAMGCDAVQGYFFSRPVALERLAQAFGPAGRGGAEDRPILLSQVLRQT